MGTDPTVVSSPYWAPRIQLFVFPEQVVVHLVVGGLEIVNIGLVRGGPRKLHVSPRPEGANDEAAFAERHKGREELLGGRDPESLKSA